MNLLAVEYFCFDEEGTPTHDAVGMEMGRPTQRDESLSHVA